MLIELIIQILRGATSGSLRTSIVRTLTPIFAGVVTSWAVRRGLNIDEAEVSTYLTPALGAVYYVVARLLERLHARFGWLLGKPATVAYVTEQGESIGVITTEPDAEPVKTFTEAAIDQGAVLKAVETVKVVSRKKTPAKASAVKKAAKKAAKKTPAKTTTASKKSS